MSAEATEKTAETPVVEKPTPVEKPVESAKIQVDPTDYAKLWQTVQELSDFKAKADREAQEQVRKAREEALAKVAETEGISAALKKQADEIKSQYEEALAAKAKVEQDWLSEKKENAVASALANVEFASKAARDQAVAILNARYDVKREDGKVVVRDRVTGQFASDQIPALIASDEFAHFLAPKSRGGTGSGGGDKPAATGQPGVVDAEKSPQFASLKAIREKERGSAIGLTASY